MFNIFYKYIMEGGGGLLFLLHHYVYGLFYCGVFIFGYLYCNKGCYNINWEVGDVGIWGEYAKHES